MLNMEYNAVFFSAVKVEDFTPPQGDWTSLIILDILVIQIMIKVNNFQI